MRVFWTLIGVLLLAGVATLVWSDRGQSPPTSGTTAVSTTLNEPLAPPTTLPEAKAAPAPEPKPEAKPEPQPDATPSASTIGGLKPGSLTETPKPAAETLTEKPAEKPADKPVDKPADKPAELAGDTQAPADLLAAPAPAPLPEAKIEQNPDGSILIDGRFKVKGAGTKEDPYVVPWELLTSVEEVYKPQQGLKQLPKRVMMFDDKYVRITGYIAYPMFVEQPRELLSMLNQWDGCCIGVPPTPYDAIEVKLDRVVTANERLATFGTIEGKLGVKPYLAGDWLVGLYLMESASLNVKEYKVGS